ncbi:MAG: hypothetical protein ACP5FL_09160, partial [Thermoplasmatota archaeon]
MTGILREENGIPVPGKEIIFYCDNQEVGAATTDTHGKHSFIHSFNTTGIHIVRAEFTGST